MDNTLFLWSILAAINGGLGIKNSVDGSSLCIMNWSAFGLCVYNIIKIMGAIG